MTRLHLMLQLVSLVGLTLAGCGGATVDHPSAVKVMNAALGATMSADGKVVNANATPTSAQVDITLTNPLGSGTAQVAGAVANNAGVVSTTLDVTFSHWTDPVANVTLDGALHEAGSFSTVAPLAGDVKLTGALAASGAVNGAVDFDLAGSYGPGGLSISGDVGGQSMSSSFTVSVH